jgi:hypothetical protein
VWSIEEGPPPEPDEAGEQLWLSQAQASAAAGIGQRQFRDAIAPRIPAAAIAGKGAKLRYELHATIAAIVDHRLDLQARELGATGTDLDEERKRLIAVNRAIREHELACRRQELVDRKRMLQAMQLGIAALRKSGERLAQKFGNEAARGFNQAVDEFQRAACQVLESEPPPTDRPAK